MEEVMTKRAVVVGITDYTGIDRSGRSNLGCCVSDAHGVADMLDSLGFDASNVIKLIDRQATRAKVMSSLQDAIAESEPGDVVLFYHSGHGSIEPADPSDTSCERFCESMCTATRP